MKRWFWILGFVALVAVMLYYTLAPEGNDQGNALANFSKVVPATIRDLKVTITASGTVDPLQTVEVKSKASGEILQMPIDDGDFVHTGDLLCRLDASTVKTQYRQAEADYNVAKVTVEQRDKELQRQKSLLDRGLIAEADYDTARLASEEAKSQLVRAEAQLENAKEAMDDTEVRSPLDGIVLSKDVEKGQIISSGISSVSGGTLICRVAQVDTVYVRALVDEIDIGHVVIGQKATVTADAFQNRPFEGTVLKVAPMAQTDQNVTTFQVTVLIDNRDGLLKAGMNATVDITTAEADSALTVPADAVQSIPEGINLRPGGNENGNHQNGQGGERVAAREGNNGGQGGQRMAARQGQGNNGGGHAGGFDPARAKAWREQHQNRKMVLVISGNDTIPKPVVTGLSNFDYVQITHGLEAGDSVLVQPQSQMMADREQMMARMRRWNAVPGIGR